MSRTAANRPYAVNILQQRSTWLIQQLALLKKRAGENAIHDARVQSRRMRAALEAFQDLIPASEWQQFYDSVRGVTRALGRIRETEVMCGLLEGLTPMGGLGEHLAREYLEEKLHKKMKKLRKRLTDGLSQVDLRLLQSRIRRLIARISRDRNESDLERAERILRSQAEPILRTRIRGQFARASDKSLHRLRIAAKKLRYSMEVFDQCWPGGLENEIVVTRALQDAGGYHQDWAVLDDFMKRESRRLCSRQRHYLAAQITGLLGLARERKSELRAQILPALQQLQHSLCGLFEPVETNP
jgi:CHAD domain-containing protein